MRTQAERWILASARIAVAGIILSGPIAVALVRFIAPQPVWSSAAVFVAHYHPIQLLPYLFGFLLIGGMLVMIAAHTVHYFNNTRLQLQLVLALVMGTVFFTLIFFNYSVQLVFIHQRIREIEVDAPLISAFTMVNPSSMSWMLEMWGYGILGIALALLIPCYSGHSLLRWLLGLNMVVSLAGAIWMIFDVQWLFTSSGLILYGVWNLLLVVILLLILGSKKPGQNSENATS